MPPHFGLPHDHMPIEVLQVAVKVTVNSPSTGCQLFYRKFYGFFYSVGGASVVVPQYYCYVCVYIRCCSIFKCFYITSSVCPIHLFQQTELPPVWKRAANSAYYLSFCCLLRYVCPCFPLMFGMGFGF